MPCTEGDILDRFSPLSRSIQLSISNIPSKMMSHSKNGLHLDVDDKLDALLLHLA